VNRPFIQFHQPSIGDAEIDEVVSVLRSGWLTTGARTAQFEKEFKQYVGAPHALAVNSCTAGLHLALAALGIGPGDEVITTPLTFCATVNTILHVGATPILADIGPDGNIDPKSIEARITERTRAIMPVHYTGLACDMEAIWDLAKRHRLKVIEDAAHAAGTYAGKLPIGAGPSDAVAFSFYATKNLTTGEGGMVTTHDQDLLDRMKVLCLHGINKDAWNRYSEEGSWFYQVTEVGFKYNLTDIQSALGIHQLRRQEEFIATRAAYARLYNDILGGLAEIETPAFPADGRHCWHLYVIRLNLDRLDIDRKGFINELRSHGIGTSVHFIPVPLHPAYRDIPTLAADLCPRTIELYPRLISLPLYPAMTEEQVRYVGETVRELAHRHSRSGAVALT
jgi:dTDP-4-amino-4,6-dideoxygalactose transaminase